MSLKDFQNVTFKYLESATSTNDVAKELCEAGSAIAVIADEQTAGRGRLGRSFHSPKGSGLYLSFAFHRKLFNMGLEKLNLITPAAAVAVTQAIHELIGLNPKIKWVNDIYLNDKKVCGILAETDGDMMVIGIGVNVLKSVLPPELKDIATSLEAEGAKVERNALAEGIVEKLVLLLEELKADEILPYYREHSLLLGREINIYKNGYPTAENPDPPVTRAKAIDIDDNGGLVVEYDDGTGETLIAGEVTVRNR